MKLLGKVVAGIGKLKVIWKGWDVRSFILASFLFQLFLILIARLRNQTSNRFVLVSVWIAYLGADWIAAQAVGLIAKVTQISDSAEADLFGLWAQFLLLHLGGPDTITALAIEDNELWLRTALHLGTQAYATLGILVRSVRQSTLWIATVLMFLAGIIKYLERVSSLRQGRLSDIDEFPYVEYYMSDIYKEDGEEGEEKKPLSNEAMVRVAYWFFDAYKCLYSDIQVKPKAQMAARKYFLKRTPEEVYKMVEMQLNFTYDAMYTKMSIMHKASWWVLRHVVLSLQVASLVIWCLWDKSHFRGYDVGVTYVLLIGAIVVDLVGFARLKLSDWNVALRDQEPSTNKINRGIWSRLQNAHLSRNRWSIQIGRYGGVPSSTIFDDFLGLSRETHLRSQVKFDRDISRCWHFIFDILTKPKEQQSYQLPNSDVTLDMNEMLRRALPIHILGYSVVFHTWTYKVEMAVVRAGDNNIHTILSQYLFYLLSFQPNMMFEAAGKEKVIRTQKYTVGDYGDDDLPACNYFNEEPDVDGRLDEDNFVILASKSIYAGVETVEVALDQMKEVVSYAYANRGWEGLDRVFGELVCHAAITCRASIHAQKLKEGGEFLTFVWLLMQHLGIQAKTST